jgi:hypothetical protein
MVLVGPFKGLVLEFVRRYWENQHLDKHLNRGPAEYKNKEFLLHELFGQSKWNYVPFL